MPIANRIFVELSPYSLQLAVMAGRRLVACEGHPIDAKEAVASFLATHAAQGVSLALVSSRQPFAHLSGEESGKVRSSADLLAYAQTLPTGLSAPLAAVACDAVTGKPVDSAGQGAWLLAGMADEALAAARNQLISLGLPVAGSTGLALTAQIGAVVAALQDMPESTRVAVLAFGDAGSLLILVSAGGVEAVRSVPVGYIKIFEAVQAALGLKFRAAASKLFFNAAYDFDEAAPKIGGSLADDLKTELAGFGVGPAALHCVGIPDGQAWFSKALAKALTLSVWTPDTVAACAQLGVEVSLAAPLPVSALGLVRLAANEGSSPAWCPSWLGTEEKPVVAAPPAPAPKPAVAPAAPAPRPAATSTKAPVKVVAAPVKTAPRPAAPVAAPRSPAPVASTPAPAPAPKPAVVATVPPSSPPPAVAPTVPVEQPAESVPSRKKIPMVPLIAGVAGILIVAGIFLFFAHARSARADALAAEVKRDPHGFLNETYRFGVSDKGVLIDLAKQGQTSPLIQQMGFIRLYAVRTLPDGQRSVYRAGDMSGPDTRATVVKKVVDGTVVFEVSVQHPKFELRQTFVCLPHSVKVKCQFRPGVLADSLGLLDAVYDVHFNEANLVSTQGKPRVKTGELVYDTKSGPMTLEYADTFKGPGENPVVGDPSLASFVFATAKDQANRVLDYEISIP
ncbi:MAG TPA: hypothetical protein VL357_08035 [Rariglobus sp.]|jgi:hypothetical protein|nr:hypothetical protein [Rariglobus sp.]